jgi:hypothetical protein
MQCVIINKNIFLSKTAGKGRKHFLASPTSNGCAADRSVLDTSLLDYAVLYPEYIFWSLLRHADNMYFSLL